MIGRVLSIAFAGLVVTLAEGAAAGETDQAPAFRATQPVQFLDDEVDAVIRRTDGCGAQPVCGPDLLPPETVLPELRWARIGRWTPWNADADLYLGAFAATGGFVRVDIVFDGLVNPPGPVFNTFNPRRYGPSPVFGFLELDVDRNVETGGDIDAPLVRYLGNVARFGGRPVGSWFDNRISVDGHDPDNLASTPPWVERSGADFELELRGDEVTTIARVAGDGDDLFEALETWDLRGRFFRRARGYDDCAAGAYAPLVWLRFSHCDTSLSASCSTPGEAAAPGSATTVSFVYPLTNAAYADANSTGLESNDIFDFNANSILEGMTALEQAAAAQLCSPTYEWWPLIASWDNQQAGDYLNPQRWRATMLWGTTRTLTVASEGNYIWSDVYPNVLAGDFNGDGWRTATDAHLAELYVAAHDGATNDDADLTSNGSVSLVNFGVWFSIYDVNYDGVVGPYDTAYSQQTPADYDNDNDVDLADYQAFQTCLSAGVVGTTPSTACRDAFDSDEDGVVRIDDFADFAARLTGP